MQNKAVTPREDVSKLQESVPSEKNDLYSNNDQNYVSQEPIVPVIVATTGNLTPKRSKKKKRKVIRTHHRTNPTDLNLEDDFGDRSKINPSDEKLIEEYSKEGTELNFTPMRLSVQPTQNDPTLIPYPGNEVQNQEDLDRMQYKYQGLKGHYKQLLSSFDQSEDLRKVYKKLVLDQRAEIQKMQDQIEDLMMDKNKSIFNSNVDSNADDAAAPISNRQQNQVDLFHPVIQQYDSNPYVPQS